MSNIVPCKACSNSFNYKPGFAGNARQLCEDCRKKVDDKELERLEEKDIIDNNRYLGNKETYDVLDILMEGNIPEFKNDGDRFVCAKEVGEFVKRTGLFGIDMKNLTKLMDSLSTVHALLLLGRLTREQLGFLKEHVAEDYKLGSSEWAKYLIEQDENITKLCDYLKGVKND